jgi:2-oxoglutarate ferredoxin oxidoreductase subunit alpha
MSKNPQVIERERVAIRFSGDSGDGMQLSGTLFSDTAALFGNDLSTFPDYPAEVRAPSGTIGGISGFTANIGHSLVNTPGDYADILVAMNPAALKANLKWLKAGAIIIVDKDNFDEKWLEKAGYTENPLKNHELDGFTVVDPPISSLVQETLKEVGLDTKSILRTRNMFALGMVYWLLDQSLEYTENFFKEKFKKSPLIVEANTRVLRAGYFYAETAEILPHVYKVHPAEIKKGKYTNLNGNKATAWGLLAAAKKANLDLFIGSYPITPATGILEELSLRKDLGVKSFQAEDEIAGVCAAIGASFAGALGVCNTSGPGLALKSEAIGLAVMIELPLVIVDVQRGGPSTGLPTKSEQSDLWQALYGRNGECPLPVLAATTPSNCFYYAYYAAKIALEHMTPVLLLTEGYLGNGSEPWRIIRMDDLPEIHPPLVKERIKEWHPYERNPETMVRSWAIPGTKGLEHRIGGLEKDALTGSVSHDPLNHQKMVEMREEKINRIIKDVPDLEVAGEQTGDLLVVGWGGTYGHLLTAVNELVREKYKIGLAQFTYIRPLPKNVGDVFGKFKKIIVCENNLGQFANYLRFNFQDFRYLQFNKIQGLPFTVEELKEKFINVIDINVLEEK